MKKERRRKMKYCKKLAKKLLCFVMLSALVITISQPVFSHAEDTQEEEQKSENMREQKNTQYDVTKPVIEKAEFLQQGQNLKEGDTICLKVYAYDAESGINQVYVEGSVENSNSFVMEGVYNEDERCYVCEHTLESVSGNVLTIYNITVADRYGNYTNWPTVDPGNGSYTFWANVEWEQPEALEVHIKNFAFNQNGQEVNEDTLLELSLEVEEVLDGDCLLACFEYEQGFGGLADILEIPLQCSDNSGHLFGNSGYQINEYSTGIRNGKWILSGLYIDKGPGKSIELRTDNLKIEDYYYTFKSSYTGEGKTDMEVPVITGVKLEKNGEPLHAGDSAHITVYATDNEKLEELCSVNFEAVSDFWGKWQSVELSYDENTGAYEGEFEVTDETYPCEWYISSIFVNDISGNMADYEPYTYGANYPYYINVVNGSTHVTPTYDLYIDFYALDQSGNWEIIDQVHKEGIERRQTMQEAGITFPKSESKYPGFKQIGWIDQEGNEVTGDTQCMYAGYMVVYAEYDKRNIGIQCKVLPEDAAVSYEFHDIILPRDATFADLKKELEKIVPESTYSGLKFQKWKLETFNGENIDQYYKDSDPLPKIPTSFAGAKAMYGNWNILNATYAYPNINNSYFAH